MLTHFGLNSKAKNAKENQFSHLTQIAQNSVVNELLGLTKKDQLKTETKKGSSREKLGLVEAAEEIILKHGDVVFRSEDLKICSPATKQILAYVLLELSEYLPQKGVTAEEAFKNSVYMLDINKYCEARGLKDKKSAKQALVTALRIINKCHFEYSYTHFVKGQNGRSYKKDNIIEGGILSLERARNTGKKGSEGGYFINGKCKIIFAPSFVEFMANVGRKYMPFYSSLLKINPRENPFSFPIGYKLQTHRFINNGGKNQNLISVKSLAKVCDFIDNPHITQTIIGPFERDLDNLQEEPIGIIASWEYTNAKGQRLSEKQFKLSSLDQWLNLYIKFQLKEYPKLTIPKSKKNKKNTSKKEAKTATK